MKLADDADLARLVLGALLNLELDAMTPDARLLLDTILAAVTELSLRRPSGVRLH